MAMMNSGFMSNMGFAGYGSDSLFSGYNRQLQNYSNRYFGGNFSTNYAGMNVRNYSINNYFNTSDSYTPTRTNYNNRTFNNRPGNNRPSAGNDSYETPLSLVAADEHARIWGDPHIVDADGGKYDFQHEGVYNVLEDKGLAVNGNLTKAKDGEHTYLTQAGLMVNGKQVHIDTDGTVTLGTGANATELEDGESRQLGNGSYISRKGDLVRVGNAEYKLEFQTNQDDRGNKHINLDAYTKDGGVALDGVNPTGLLGETFDKDSKALTKTKLKAADYERADLFATELSQEEEPAGEENPFFGTFG